MKKKFIDNKKKVKYPIDEYYECLSYCDITPKGIDRVCEIICVEKYLKNNIP